MIFLTLTPMNKSVKFELKKTIFFLKKKDRHVLYIRFAFHSKNLRIKYTKKSIKKCKGPINK